MFLSNNDNQHNWYQFDKAALCLSQDISKPFNIHPQACKVTSKPKPKLPVEPMKIVYQLYPLIEGPKMEH